MKPCCVSRSRAWRHVEQRIESFVDFCQQLAQQTDYPLHFVLAAVEQKFEHPSRVRQRVTEIQAQRAVPGEQQRRQALE
jgi:hypothetical protein